MSQARVLHKCKQRHGWIEHNNISKSSLLNMLKRDMDHSVATRIHGIHPCKDGMAYFKTHVGLKFIGGTH